jgi:hypothetical protein
MASKSYGSLAQPITRADILALKKTVEGVKIELNATLERILAAIEKTSAKSR